MNSGSLAGTKAQVLNHYKEKTDGWMDGWNKQWIETQHLHPLNQSSRFPSNPKFFLMDIKPPTSNPIIPTHDWGVQQRGKRSTFHHFKDS